MSKIIKGGGSGGAGEAPHRHVAEVLPDAGGVVHKRVLDAREHAEKILAEAETQAAAIRDEAARVLEDAKAKREEAIRTGYAQGESKGLAQVTEKLVAIEQLRDRFYANAEPEVVKLVTAIAEKVMGRALAENPGLIRDVIRQALEKALGDRITVRLHPEDHRALLEGDREFKDLIDRTRRLLFRDDETISRGGCVVETEIGTIDAQLETQMKAIRKALES